MAEASNNFLQTVDAVLDAAGGDTVVGRRLGYKDGRAVWNWRQRGRFPPSTYVGFQQILGELNAKAPDSLWRQRRTA